ncbi:MAG: hypothetical protein WBP43_16385, partial [Chitinophagales bacterium]
MRLWIGLLCIFSFSLIGCNKDKSIVNRCFYYWQQDFTLSNETLNTLTSLEINKLYVKFFDVNWDKATAQPSPVANIHFSSEIPAGIEIIPVVFITNETLSHLDSAQTTMLAQKISKRIQGVIETNKIATPQEIQLDCDWTESTRENYFLLISTMKNFPDWKNTLWSATIRLHQIKYAEQTGIPPVNRGMLMFYNMGNIEDISAENSIYDAATAELYTNRISEYPLPLDAALPCYSWGLLFDGQELLKIFYPLYPAQVDEKYFIKKSQNQYIAKGNFYFRGQF